MIIDLRGDDIDGGAPDPSRVNIGVGGGGNQYDQIHVFETLTLDGVVEFDVLLQDGFIPQTDDFFDILSADQILLSGSLDFDFPIVGGLTFVHEILSLPDPVFGGVHRDVLRITFGVAADFPPGDYSQDGVVDAADYSVWRDSVGQSGSGLAADGDGDGDVDTDDYAVWVADYGATVPASSLTVPEPATAFLAGAILACALADRRR